MADSGRTVVTGARNARGRHIRVQFLVTGEYKHVERRLWHWVAGPRHLDRVLARLRYVVETAHSPAERLCLYFECSYGTAENSVSNQTHRKCFVCSKCISYSLYEITASYGIITSQPTIALIFIFIMNLYFVSVFLNKRRENFSSEYIFLQRF